MTYEARFTRGSKVWTLYHGGILEFTVTQLVICDTDKGTGVRYWLEGHATYTSRLEKNCFLTRDEALAATASSV